MINSPLYEQPVAQASPQNFRARAGRFAWALSWALLCAWTPKPLNRWRIFWLKCFGAKIQGLPFVHQRARIEIPWKLTLHDRSCLGDRATACSLGEIEINEAATVAQEVHLGTVTPEFADPAPGLRVPGIIIGAHAFVGARALIMPGVTIGEGAIVGACAIVTGNVAPAAVVAGNPARKVGCRTGFILATIPAVSLSPSPLP